MRRLTLLAVAVAATVVASRADAQLYGVEGESPRSHMIEVKLGPYTPDIDSEGGDAYSRIFGDSAMVLFKFEYNYQFWQEYGSLAVGAEIGYGSVTGNGIETGTGTASSVDETTLHIVPMTLAIIYHLDIFAVNWNVPLVPYAKLGLDYYIWWVDDAEGETATANGIDGNGDTWGWHIAVGLKILLDVFAPTMAQTFDIEVGVNNSYIFAELLYADVSDFGSNASFQLGDLTALFGLAFEF